MHLPKRRLVLMMMWLVAAVIVSFWFFGRQSSLVKAEGTYGLLGTTNDQNGGADAVNWSQAYPLMIDAYGHYLSYIQSQTNGYKWIYSNDTGGTWAEIEANTTLNNRPAAVYDPVNDKIHALVANGGDVVYRRYRIKRDVHYNIVNIIVDSEATAMGLDDDEGCINTATNNPFILWRDNGSNGIIVAFWSMFRECGGTQISETRASMRTLSNTNADVVQSNWEALDGTSDAGGSTSPALVDYDKLYGVTGVLEIFQHSGMIQSGSGAHAGDIYYFNVDENDTNGFQRLEWTGSNWSGSSTSRVTFGGDVNNAQGYSLKHELLSKPVYDDVNDRVYVGIARWLDNTNGDTQSLFYIDSSDAPVLGANVYSAGGAHCLYPTFDLMYDSVDNLVYFFYDISAGDNTCGHAYYKTFDGSGLGTATPFFTLTNRSADIPIVHQDRSSNNRALLLFRVNNESTPGTPPHDIYFGYLDLPNPTASPTPTVITSPYQETSFAVFDLLCTLSDTVQATNISGGEVELQATLRDDFEPRHTPYDDMFANWGYGNFGGGTTYRPDPQGTITIYDSGAGAFVYDNSVNNRKVLEFRAKFTNDNFQHIGWADVAAGEPAFNQFIMFSTFNNGQLNIRDHLGSTALGSSYLDAFHTYRIEWNATSVEFFIDGASVGTLNDTINESLNFIATNNTLTAGSDLELDWVKMYNYPDTTGTFESCSINSGLAETAWVLNNTVSTTIPAGTSVTIQARTSNDNTSWSAWSSALGGGDAVPTKGQFIQYQVTFSGTSTETSSLNNIEFGFSSPPDAPTGLAQYKSDGTTSIATGASTDEDTVKLALNASDADASDILQVEVEVQPIGSAFTDVATHTQADVDYNGTPIAVQLTVGSLIDTTGYHWQARVCDDEQCSTWVSYGGNAESAADFISSINDPPTAPSSLGSVDVTTGSTITDTTPTFTYTLSDPDTGQQVSYQIQVDDNADFGSPLIDFTSALGAQGSHSFTVGQATLGGSYATGSVGQQLGNGTYYWRVRTIDASSEASVYTESNNGGVAFVVDIQVTPTPTPTASPTATATSTPSPTSTSTPAATSTTTATPPVSDTPTVTDSVFETITPLPTNSGTPMTPTPVTGTEDQSTTWRSVWWCLLPLVAFLIGVIIFAWRRRSRDNE